MWFAALQQHHMFATCSERIPCVSEGSASGGSDRRVNAIESVDVAVSSKDGSKSEASALCDR